MTSRGDSNTRNNWTLRFAQGDEIVAQGDEIETAAQLKCAAVLHISFTFCLAGLIDPRF